MSPETVGMVTLCDESDPLLAGYRGLLDKCTEEKEAVVQIANAIVSGQELESIAKEEYAKWRVVGDMEKDIGAEGIKPWLTATKDCFYHSL